MPKGDIYFVDLPSPPGGVGHEQSGTRPSVILFDDISSNLPTVVVIPLTGNQYARRFAYTHPINSSNSNGLTQDSIALVFQIRALDRSRILNKVGRLEQEHIEQLDRLLRAMLSL